ncbi:MAG: FHA domain-containing protein [Akkermansiaceae bacterium]|nr:FHA domain-containing protein [Akkermansiaceae bacterium]
MPRITITVPEKNPQPYRFDLGTQVVTMGRELNNDIVIDCGSVSKHHAEMRRIKGGYELRDLGSTNGVSLNEMHHRVIPLLNGLNVKVGDATFDFLLTEAEIETLELEKNAEVAAPLLKPANSEFDRPQPSPVARQYATYEPAESSGSSFGTIFLAMTLITIAFLVGLHMRHQKETGNSLIESIQSRTAR